MRILAAAGVLTLSIAYAGGAYAAPSYLASVASPVYVQAGNVSLYVSWDKVEGIDNYRVQAYEDDTAVGKQVLSSTDQAKLTGLVNEKEYTVLVQGEAEEGTWVDVGSASGKPLPVAPQSAYAPTLNATTNSTITVTVKALSSAGISPIDGYQIRFTPSNGGEPVLVSSQELKATGTGLMPYTEYSIDYAGINEVDGKAQVGPYSAKALLATPTGAPAVSNLEVVKESNHTVWLDWADLEGADRYVVRYYPLDDETAAKKTATILAENAAPSDKKVTGLDNGREYAFEVAAQTYESGKLKTGDYCDPVVATPVTSPVPADLSVTGIGSGKIYVDWADVAGAESYYLKATVQDAGDQVNPKVPGPIKIAASAVGNARVISNLSNDVTYRLQVASTLNAVAGDYSQELVLATPMAVPGPVNPTKVSVSANAIGIKWAVPAAIDGVQTANRYKVVATPSNGSAPIEVESTANSYTFTGLTAGVTYTFSVQAGNDAGWGMSSATPLALVASDKPGAVLNAATDRVEDGTVALVTWQEPAYQGGAKVSSYTVNAKQVSPVGTAPPAQRGLTSPTAVFAGLDPQADYTFTIIANTDAGAGPGITVGSLHERISLEGSSSFDYETGTASFAWEPILDNPKLSYQAQAVQEPGKGSSATFVTPANVACSQNTCLATFDRFSDNINGEAWSFRVRATDNINATTGWFVAQNPELKVNENSIVVNEEGQASCPEGSTLSGSNCVETSPYTYSQVQTGQYQCGTHNINPCHWPDGSTTYNNCGTYPAYCPIYETRKNAPPAGWSDDGSQYVKSTPALETYSYSLKTAFDWASRSNQGVVNWFVNGALTAGGKSANLGRCPGSVSSALTGLNGTFLTMYNLCK